MTMLAGALTARLPRRLAAGALVLLGGVALAVPSFIFGGNVGANGSVSRQVVQDAAGPANPSAPKPAMDVADLLRNLPPAGTSVEPGAYFSSAGAPTLTGMGRRAPPIRFAPDGSPPPARVVCPERAYLTSRPFPHFLWVFNRHVATHVNDGDTWLTATVPETTQPNVGVDT